MDQRLLVYGVLVLVGVAGACGDIAINFWAKSHRWEWWIASCVVWIGVATLFGVMLRWEHFTFGVAVILALLIHSLCAVAFDWFWYNTSLTTVQWVGVALAFLSIVLVEAGKRPDATHTQEKIVVQE